jgi:3-phosphoshikimate 1-carboxyvinyltransferase
MRCEESVVIENPMAVHKSYPHFFEDYKLLGGLVDE